MLGKNNQLNDQHAQSAESEYNQVEFEEKNLKKLAQRFAKFLGGIKSNSFLIDSHSKENNSEVQPSAEERYFISEEVGNSHIQHNLSLYLSRLCTIGEFVKEDLILAEILAERFILCAHSCVIQNLNYFKLYASALFIAQKFLHEDSQWRIPEFSEISGLSKRVIRKGEERLLIALDFDIFVKEDMYRSIEKTILSEDSN